MHRFREIVAVAGVIIFLFLLRTPSAPAFTPEEERQLLRDVTEIKATLRVFMEQTNKRFEDMNRRFEDINKRFEDINKRFEDINKRFEDINKRFEEVNHRFDQLYTFLWIITGIFTSIMVAVIAFALWDRRTIVNRARDEAVERLLGILRDYAREEPRLREILRRYGFA
ncbi:hypothetical protein [Thermosulfurimonas sp. F29]|uniref:hypothetical protein n=1 Tax=Thermosulfurimonas sp. F29 TaxID=2867247 RepID=UPI001C82F490|nr:hypothetical protein [Thermosulfurimonas sp. F29]MBX6423515.1 hypothetical protein [Thermosulfurimonas sp. F29]